MRIMWYFIYKIYYNTLRCFSMVDQEWMCSVIKVEDLQVYQSLNLRAEATKDKNMDLIWHLLDFSTSLYQILSGVPNQRFCNYFCVKSAYLILVQFHVNSLKVYFLEAESIPSFSPFFIIFILPIFCSLDLIFSFLQKCTLSSVGAFYFHVRISPFKIFKTPQTEGYRRRTKGINM